MSESAIEIDRRYLYLVLSLNAETRIPLDVLGRMIQWESGWVRGKVSPENTNGTHDLGLMAINEANLEEWAWRYNDGRKINPFDAETNLRVGMRHLARMYRATGSWYAAVWAYNTGLNGYRAGVCPESTKNYLRFVFGEGAKNGELFENA